MMKSDKDRLTAVFYFTEKASGQRDFQQSARERSGNFTEFRELLKQYGLSQSFSLAVNDEVSAIPDAIPPQELARRKDLRGVTVVTIDGEDAKDLDDAVSVERLEHGNYLLGVHIADVGYYVKEGSEIDREAFQRGTSVYLVDKVVPMLPKKLSNGLCSLNPRKPRLTMSCFMEIDSAGGVRGYDIAETYIISAARLTYAKVTEVLDGDMAARNEYAALVPVLERMRELALILRDKRTRRGSIDFNFPEPKLVTDDKGRAIEVKLNTSTISNKIIEEFMLAANETVAGHMFGLQLPSVYRVHEKPDPEKAERLTALVRNMKYKFKGKREVTPKDLQGLLFQIKDTPEQRMLSTMILRSMMKARYSNKNLGHFGLAAEYYCHFTSPIRRYPDLMVHRILREMINGRLSKKRITRYAKLTKAAAVQSSETEMHATEAERDWVAYKLCEYMEDQVGAEFDGVIVSVTSFGLFVQLPNTVEGLIRMTDLDDDYYEYDEAAMTLTGRRGGRQYRVGMEMKVRLAKVNTDLKQIDFVPIKEDEKSDGAEKKGEKKSEKKGEKKKEVKEGNGRKTKRKRKARRSKQKSAT